MEPPSALPIPMFCNITGKLTARAPCGWAGGGWGGGVGGGAGGGQGGGGRGDLNVELKSASGNQILGD